MVLELSPKVITHLFQVLQYKESFSRNDFPTLNPWVVPLQHPLHIPLTSSQL